MVEESLLSKGFQWSIIDQASSGPGVGVSTKGQPHSISLTYEPSISLSGSLALQVLGIVRLDRLACSGGPMVVSAAGASLTA